MNPRLCRIVLAFSWPLVLMIGSASAQSPQLIAPAVLESLLAEPLATPPSGSSQGDVTIIEYFDYNCPVCRTMAPQLRQLLAKDPKVRLVHKDWPVFGDASVYAAYCSFSAAREGKYALAHDALIGSKKDLDSVEDVQQVLSAAGFDVQKINADIALHRKEYGAMLERNFRESAALGLRGTPGLIIGNQLVPGGLNYPQLERLVSVARQHH